MLAILDFARAGEDYTAVALLIAVRHGSRAGDDLDKARDFQEGDQIALGYGGAGEPVPADAVAPRRAERRNDEHAARTDQAGDVLHIALPRGEVGRGGVGAVVRRDDRVEPAPLPAQRIRIARVPR